MKKKYAVLESFGQHKKGDQIELLEKQAKYRVLSGQLALTKQQQTEKTDDRIESKQRKTS